MYLEYPDDVQTAGSYLFEPAGSTHTLRSDEGAVVNNKGDTMHYYFNIKSNRFCFSGNIDAYRMSDKYVDEPFCFKYNKAQKDMMREY